MKSARQKSSKSNEPSPKSLKPKSPEYDPQRGDLQRPKDKRAAARQTTPPGKARSK